MIRLISQPKKVVVVVFVVDVVVVIIVVDHKNPIFEFCQNQVNNS